MSWTFQGIAYQTKRDGSAPEASTAASSSARRSQRPQMTSSLTK